MSQPRAAWSVDSAATPPGLRLPVRWKPYAGSVIMVCGMLPAGFTAMVADDYNLAFQLDYFVLMMRLNFIGLIFPLAAAAIYCLPFGSLVRERFMTYVRARCSVRALLLRAFLSNAAVTGGTFLALVGLLYALSLWQPPRFHPEIYVGGTPYTPTTFATFSEVAVVGDWLFVLVVGAWFAVHGICYAWLSMSIIVLTGSRLMGLSLPWVIYSVMAFVMAVFDLAAFSPDMVTPFNMVQIPSWKPVLELLGLAAASSAAAGLVILRSPFLPRLQ